MHPLRPVILAAARSTRLKAGLERAPITREIVTRFVAGDDRVDALAAAAAVTASGRLVTVDLLGEDITDRAAAGATLTEYTRVVELLGDSGMPEPEVSVKLSSLGRALAADGPQLAVDNLRALCTAGARHGVLVTVDAEDHTTTDHTLAAVAEVRRDFPWLGVVVQAYLRRTEADCKDFSGADSRVRLCKGAYREPKSVAYQDKSEVDDSYRRCVEVLLSGAGYPMIATHDPAMIEAAEQLATRHRPNDPHSYEYQMLYGIRVPEQLRLAESGHRMRVYVPYGTQWYAYFMRRLAERPANLAFFLRALRKR